MVTCRATDHHVMFDIGTPFTVAESIVRDHHNNLLVGYSALHALHKVLDKEESVISKTKGGKVSYIWWEIQHDEEFKIVADLGKINYRYQDSLVHDIWGNDNGETLFNLPWDRYGDFMIHKGISYGQRMLSRVFVDYEADEYEADWVIRSKVIFTRAQRKIDIPFTFRNPLINRKATKIYVD